MLVEEPAAIVFVEDAREAPGLVLEGLHVLDLNEEDIAWFGGLDLERPGKVVDLSQINVLDIVSTVVVLDLPARPVEAFNFDGLAVLDGAAKGNCRYGERDMEQTGR